MKSQKISNVDLLARTRQMDLHKHAISGELANLGVIPFSYDLSLINPKLHQSKKGCQSSHVMDDFIRELNRDFHEFMERLYIELEALRIAIEKLELEMQQNRNIWEKKIETLNGIDDLFCEFEKCGHLNTYKAAEIFKRANIDVPENLSDAQWIVILEQLRTQSHRDIEQLDITYTDQEKTHIGLRQREKDINTAIEDLNSIDQDHDLDDQGKLVAIRLLSDQVGSNTLHDTAAKVQDNEVAEKVDHVLDHSDNNARKENAFNPSGLF